jgi:putative flippase GtrA
MNSPPMAARELLLRWGRFNLVGVMGTAVQLGALALFARLHQGRPDQGHYLLASAAALELTLLHNFLWHRRYTWRGRQGPAIAQFLRFQLSNGLVSLAGNLGLMRLLVHREHMPVVIANAVAILCCSAANFCLGDRWAFASARSNAP